MKMLKTVTTMVGRGVRLAYPVTAQWVGFGTVIAGLFLLVGLAWTLVAGGLSLVTLGILAEGGRL